MTKKALRPKLIVIAGPNGAIAMAIVDRAYGYDNSVDNREPKKLFRTKDGQVFKTYADLKMHEWGQMMIEELAKPA